MVLDLSRLLPGGYCTLLLAELGADVIKVEEPGRGDYIRWTSPIVDGESAPHRALNRGKRSVTLNLKSDDGAGLLRRLAGRADVLIESFRPGVTERLGLGFDALSAANPRLIYCAITGYGQDGPYRDLAGHDINFVGYGGMLSLANGPGRAPAVPGVQMGDLGGGMFAVIGVLSALVEREISGRGRFVDVSMLDGVVSWLSIQAGTYFATGGTAVAGGLLSGGFACYRVYQTKDGRFVTVGAVEPKFWKALCEALGCPELVGDQYGPAQRQEEAARVLQSVFLRRTRDEWMEVLGDVPACVGPVNDVAEAMADPQIRHRGMVAEIDGLPVGPGSALKVRGASDRLLGPAPGLGEHTAEVLAGIGVDPDELAALRAGGVV